MTTNFICANAQAVSNEVAESSKAVYSTDELVDGQYYFRGGCSDRNPDTIEAALDVLRFDAKYGNSLTTIFGVQLDPTVELKGLKVSTNDKANKLYERVQTVFNLHQEIGDCEDWIEDYAAAHDLDYCEAQYELADELINRFKREEL